MAKLWDVAKPRKELQDLLAKECRVSRVMAQLLINRGITKASEVLPFLKCDLSGLHDPHLLKDADKAAARIRRAVSCGEKMMVYGDYDVDGVAATALLASVLREMGGHVVTYIPDRIEEGYGLNHEAAHVAGRKGVSLLITVDCGITDRDEVAHLAGLGIEAIVTDHHKLCDGAFPDKAYAVINPLQSECRYPFKHLSGVGVAYKLASILTEDISCDIDHHLDLVALGTVQDLVPQLGENRILTRFGIEQLNRTRKAGIRELIKVAGLEKKAISTYQIGFMLGPRINAAGRVGSSEMALRLLMTEDAAEAAELAGALNDDNRNRQRIEGDMLRSAIERIENEFNFKEDKVIVLEGDGWHPGVVGIVASRITERFCRPTVMIALDNGNGVGSARSIKNFHLFAALQECREYLNDFGGHAGACGLKIHKDNVPKFRERLNEVAGALLTADDFLPRLTADMEISLSAVSGRLIKELELLAPFGPGNLEPLFISRGLTLKRMPKALARDGIKLWVTDKDTVCEAVGFGMKESAVDITESKSVDLAYTPVMNTWNGVTSIQLNLKDIKANLI